MHAAPGAPPRGRRSRRRPSDRPWAAAVTTARRGWICLKYVISAIAADAYLCRRPIGRRAMKWIILFGLAGVVVLGAAGFVGWILTLPPGVAPAPIAVPAAETAALIDSLKSSRR